MASIYDPVISTLFSTGKAEVTCHKDQESLIIGNVKKVKSQRNRMRKEIGMLQTSKMSIEVVKLSDHKIKLVFELSYSVDV